MAGKIKKGAAAGGSKVEGLKTTPVAVSVMMTMRQAQLAEKLRAKVFVGSPEQGFAVSDPKALKSALTLLGGEAWANELLGELDTSLRESAAVEMFPVPMAFPI